MASNESSWHELSSRRGLRIIRAAGQLSACELDVCAQVFNRGDLIAFPTDTVYGVGADAGNPEAVRRLFRAKGRPADKPLPVLVGHQADLHRFGRDVPAEAEALAEAFWPGPLTIVVRSGRGICPEALAYGDTVGLRMPDHSIALQLLRHIYRPMAVTSANLSGIEAPVSASGVIRMLGSSLAVLIASDDRGSGVPSTVLDLTSLPFRILRQGAVTLQQLAAVVGEVIVG